ncbi:molybdopterin oxidoreductase family protein [uncultured Vibrio sp.]|uniref:molybdopterin oxidoreductase family protein n=1 Tax=uncultured Vibrio sp. TaxID=114054 RepID=UPI00092498DD|nr:nitrate reductase [uncultured Vibrio sp.]OIQ25571.1 MAG: nitrate reductase [Vibrio sp. MedPE-SWchi]
MNKDNEGWIKTTCAYCGVGCGVEARPMSSGKLDIRGDQSHPSNFGKLCTKGIALGDTVIQDGRLLHPTHITERQSHREDARKHLQWDEATQLVADKFSQAIEQYGPDSVAFYVSGQLLTEDYYVANKLMKGFIGSSNIDSNSRLCMASSVVGHKRAFGTDTVPVTYQDLEQSELVVIVGSNLAWCHPVLFQRLRQAKQTNPAMKVIVVDPRETETCTIADQHLAVKSGADVALFNGLLSYLDENGSVNSEFVAKHTQGFYSAMKQAKEQPDVAEITGLAADELIEFYQTFSTTDKVVTIYSQGVNQSSQGCDKVNSIINCHLATGKIGKLGSGPFSVTGQPNAMGGREVGALANTLAAHVEFDDPLQHQLISEFWQTDALAKQPGLKAIELFDAMADGKIKAVWIMGTNPMVSLPDSDKIKLALETCPFVVVSDCIEDTETTRMADVVLPAQGWSEKSGTVTNSERRISRQRRVLPSPGSAKPDWWIISAVAKKMGFESRFNYRHEGEVFKEYARLTSLGHEQKPRDLNLIGLTQLDDFGYSRLVPQQWPVVDLQAELVHHALFQDNQFFTASGKANFVAVTHVQPLSETNERYPLVLNSGRTRDHWHTMSRTGLSPRLASHAPEPYVQVHPKTARLHHIVDQQLVEVTSDIGKVIARASVTREVSPQQLFMPIHWNAITAKQSKPCELISPISDKLSGQPEFKHTPATVSPLSMLSSAVVLSSVTVECEPFDYWSRQKIEGGYLYRIESFLDQKALTALIKSSVAQPSGEVMETTGTDVYRSVSVQQDRCQQLVWVGSTLDEEEINHLIAQFDKTYDEQTKFDAVLTPGEQSAA